MNHHVPFSRRKLNRLSLNTSINSCEYDFLTNTPTLTVIYVRMPVFFPSFRFCLLLLFVSALALSASVCLPAYLFLSVCVSRCLSLSVPASFCLSACLRVCMSVSPAVCLCHHLSMCMYLHLFLARRGEMMTSQPASHLVVKSSVEHQRPLR